MCKSELENDIKYLEEDNKMRIAEEAFQLKSHKILAVLSFAQRSAGRYATKRECE